MSIYIYVYIYIYLYLYSKRFISQFPHSLLRAVSYRGWGLDRVVGFLNKPKTPKKAKPRNHVKKKTKPLALRGFYLHGSFGGLGFWVFWGGGGRRLLGFLGLGLYCFGFSRFVAGIVALRVFSVLGSWASQPCP